MKASTVTALLVVILVAIPIFIQSDCDSKGEQGNACEGTAASIADNAGLIAAVVGIAGLAFWASVKRSEDEEAKAAITRPCPRCGEAVEVGVLDCPHCEFDFRTIGSSQSSSIE